MVTSEHFEAVYTPTVQVYSFLQVISSILNCAVKLWLPVMSEFNSAYARHKGHVKSPKYMFREILDFISK